MLTCDKYFLFFFLLSLQSWHRCSVVCPPYCLAACAAPLTVRMIQILKSRIPGICTKKLCSLYSLPWGILDFCTKCTLLKSIIESINSQLSSLKSFYMFHFELAALTFSPLKTRLTFPSWLTCRRHLTLSLEVDGGNKITIVWSRNKPKPKWINLVHRTFNWK